MRDSPSPISDYGQNFITMLRSDHFLSFLRMLVRDLTTAKHLYHLRPVAFKGLLLSHFWPPSRSALCELVIAAHRKANSKAFAALFPRSIHPWKWTRTVMIEMTPENTNTLWELKALSAFTSCNFLGKCVIYLFKINFLQVLSPLSNFSFFLFFPWEEFCKEMGLLLSFLKSLGPGFLTND